MVTVATTSMVSLASLDEILGVRTCFVETVSVLRTLLKREEEREVSLSKQHTPASESEKRRK
jgi:hypothetical protein